MGVRDPQEVTQEVSRIAAALKSQGLPHPRRDADALVKDTLEKFAERGLITKTDAVFEVTDAGLDILTYYGRSIAHHFETVGILHSQSN